MGTSAQRQPLSRAVRKMRRVPRFSQQAAQEFEFVRCDNQREQQNRAAGLGQNAGRGHEKRFT